MVGRCPEKREDQEQDHLPGSCVIIQARKGQMYLKEASEGKG